MTELIFYIFAVSFFLCTSLWLGIYALLLSPKEKTNRLFSLSVAILSLIYLTMILIQIPGSETASWFFYRIATSLVYFFFYSMLLFIIFLTRSYKFLKISHFVLALCILFTAITLMSEQYVIFTRIGSLLVLSGSLNKEYHWINPVFYVLVLLLYAVILFPHIKSGGNRERRQYLIILSTLIISCSIMMLFFLIQIFLLYGKFPIGLMPILFIIFITGCLFAIKKYRMLSLTPELVSADILANVNESVILLSAEQKIITANPATTKITQHTALEGKKFESIIPENKKICEEINGLLDNKMSDFSCRLYYIDIYKKNISMDARFSVVKDSFKDAIGVLVIAREVKEIGQLKSAFKITDREAEIIQNIIMGHPNPEIAKVLNISANTLKQHITNIYNKLGVSNKIQLLSLLKEFNLIPSQKAEKSLLLIN